MSQTIEKLLAALTGGDEAAAVELAMLPEAQQAQALAALQGRLESTGVDERWWAARALAALPGAQATPLLIQALQDEDA